MTLLGDGGPMYTETDLSRFPVEPFNTVSNLLFLFVVIYWWRRKKRVQDPRFLLFLNVSLPLLFIGYVGGTVYHATRSHIAWMFMDVLPIYAIGLITAIYHWLLIEWSIPGIFATLFLMLVIPLSVLWTLFPASSATQTIGYMILSFPVTLPLIIDLIKTQWRYFTSFLLPFVLIILALSCRALDSAPWIQQNFPVGTHWLWHVLGALTCQALLLHMERRSRKI